MKLSFEQVKTITSGWMNAEEKEGTYRFYRFTPQQTAYYYESSRDFWSKTFATSGIRFDFVTDSEFFSFTYDTVIASSRRWYFFDIYVDDTLVSHKGEQVMWINHGTITTKLPEGEHRVTVWFPCLTAASVSDVNLSDGAAFRPYTYKRTMLCLGDSITQGYDATFPSLAYTNALARHFDAKVVNQAIGGEKFVPGLFTGDMTYSPDFVTVAYGTNDWSGFTREMFFERCDAFLEGIAPQFPNSKIFIITPLWRGDKDKITKFGSYFEAVKYIADKARSCGLNVIDGYNLTPHWYEFYSDQRLHPNDLGYGEYTRNLIPEIEKKL